MKQKHVTLAACLLAFGLTAQAGFRTDGTGSGWRYLSGYVEKNSE